MTSKNKKLENFASLKSTCGDLNLGDLNIISGRGADKLPWVPTTKLYEVSSWWGFSTDLMAANDYKTIDPDNP